jgi:threonine dehydrogenase-like Zn-dependent dehydrogenase
VGQFAILSAFQMGAGRVLAVDNIASRLVSACAQGAEVINFDEINPMTAILELTRGIGPDRVIDAVGVDARAPTPNAEGELLLADDELARLERQRSQVSPLPWQEESASRGSHVPSQALDWATELVSKAGTLAIVGVYPPRFETFPLGKAFQKNLTVKMGICPHRRYIGKLLQLVASGAIELTKVVPRHEPLLSATEAYEAFDRRESGWLQVELVPAGSATPK